MVSTVTGDLMGVAGIDKTCKIRKPLSIDPYNGLLNMSTLFDDNCQKKQAVVLIILFTDGDNNSFWNCVEIFLGGYRKRYLWDRMKEVG